MASRSYHNFGLTTENILMMYLYVWGYSDYVIRELDDSEYNANFLHFLAEVFSKRLSTAIRRGLNKTYAPRHQWVAGVRGRIDIATLARRPDLAIGRLPCEFEELSHSTPANRVIALACLRRRQELRKEGSSHSISKSIELAGLQSRLPEPLEAYKQIDFVTLAQRQSSYLYQVLLFFSRLILRPLRLDDGDKEFETPDKMQQGTLFERFLIKWFIERKIKASIGKYGARQHAWNESPSDFLPNLKTDVEVHFDDRIVVLDAKCYKNVFTNNHNKWKLHSGNLFQMYSYMSRVQALTTKHVSGGLIYSHSPNIDNPSEAPSRVQLAEFELTLDYLGMDKLKFTEVEAKLEAIAQRLEAQANAPLMLGQ
ncbi:MAG: hypothetical protein KDB07_00070 [Planctomycetes bacterium]|nr:hypothetical protein [Planctomycetota bacterium]